MRAINFVSTLLPLLALVSCGSGSVPGTDAGGQPPIIQPSPVAASTGPAPLTLPYAEVEAETGPSSGT